MKIPKNNFPVLGAKSQTYQLIDLSVNGIIAKQEKENWYSYLSELPTAKASIIYYGGYLEQRFFYSNEKLFGSGDKRRDYHLGVDLWVSINTPIYTPYDAIIESIKYNDSELDYGHTIILKHKVNEQIFFSLYGHLSSSHIGKLKVNDTLQKGDIFCTIGAHSENGGWPPHLHLQLMVDLENHIGDYPGVSSTEKLSFYRQNCPDPTPLIFV